MILEVTMRPVAFTGWPFLGVGKIHARGTRLMCGKVTSNERILGALRRAKGCNTPINNHDTS